MLIKILLALLQPKNFLSFLKWKKKGFTISFTKRVMLVSIAVSLITIISSVVVLSAVWNQHFQSYTRENVQRVADGTAAAIADGYEQSNGDWYGGALSAATSASSLYDSVYLQVRTIDGTIVYDDRANDVLGSVDVKEDGSNVASAPIMVDGERWARYWCVFQDRKHS